MQVSGHSTFTATELNKQAHELYGALEQLKIRRAQGDVNVSDSNIAELKAKATTVMQAAKLHLTYKPEDNAAKAASQSKLDKLFGFVTYGKAVCQSGSYELETFESTAAVCKNMLQLQCFYPIGRAPIEGTLKAAIEVIGKTLTSRDVCALSQTSKRMNQLAQSLLIVHERAKIACDLEKKGYNFAKVENRDLKAYLKKSLTVNDSKIFNIYVDKTTGLVKLLREAYAPTSSSTISNFLQITVETICMPVEVHRINANDYEVKVLTAANDPYVLRKYREERKILVSSTAEKHKYEDYIPFAPHFYRGLK